MKAWAYIFIVWGLAMIVLCVVMRIQFNDFVAQPKQNLDEYPLLKIVDDPNVGKNASGAAGPAARAQVMSKRIYEVGIEGILLLGMGVWFFVIARRKHRAKKGGD